MKRIVKIAAGLLVFILALTNLSDIIITASANNSSSVSGSDAIAEADSEFLEDAGSVVAEGEMQAVEESSVNYADTLGSVTDAESEVIAYNNNEETYSNTAITSGDWKYTISENEVTIVSYLGSDSEIAIPDEMDGYPVTIISESAFYDCSGITDITIPDSVTTIEDYAFMYCTGLTSITFPQSLKSLGNRVLYGFRGSMIYFTGDAPYIMPYAFEGLEYSPVSLMYPANNSTWTTDVISQGYGGTAQWLAYTPSEDEGTKILSDNDIASGTYWNLTWVIDANGKLTVEGTGDFSSYTQYDRDTRAPWYSSRNAITSAEVKVTGMTNASYMFYDCNNLTSLDLSGFDTSNVTDMCGMFSRCSSLTSVDLSNFDTSNVTDMPYMFDSCRNLTNVDLSNFDTSNVTNVRHMFDSCRNLTNVDLSNFDTSNVTDMRYMFESCNNLTNVDLSNFDTSNVTDMQGMFWGCFNLASIDLSNFDTSNVTDMRAMFINCEKLISLDLSNFDTSNVTSMSEMFDGCEKLTNLDLSNFDTSNVTICL